ncbi:hypothetical protein GF412_00135 [Candidatus Micrarchaeota archaeon]|nr:hypothetical protein [Candidatus Micrarchaeota archaeon]MBD3417383.1 hypothetical protein [Candidatus Micrarchaeota archaeon]
MAVDFNEIQTLSLLAAGITLITMGMVYALGTLLNNPRFTVWVKTEIFQVFVSVVIVFVILFAIGLIGLDPDADFKITGNWLILLSPGAEEYIDEYDTVFEVDKKYLESLAGFDYNALTGARASMGMYDEFSKYTKQPCQPGWLFCMFGANGVSIRPLSGAIAPMQGMNLLMYTTTVSYLTVLIQLAFLKFIKSGLIAVYLPFAIVLRSLPFMRQFGGGLLAICLSLFLVYPTLLFVEAAFWNPESIVDDYETSREEVADVSNNELDDRTVYGIGSFAHPGEWSFSKTIDSLKHVIKLCSAAFIVSTFLFTVNILAAAAAARAFGRIMGADVDISRMAQII